ncbi:transmembrane secretion effector [Actinocorallia herbida]|uniref:Transmembrane secretion effector n=2 Tax=Actinocorallia herbida TaxID=58109 RepID=A0A3N1CVF3_9ACTN|nr:transmembrane secretion effector [Actinocorallia herbida]
MSGPALLLAGLAATGSVASASSLLAGITVSAAVGGPVFGALLDRAARPGRLLAMAFAVYAGALTVILVSLGRVPVWASVLVALGAGLLGPALSGGWTSQLPHSVPRAGLPRATALDAMTFNVASLAGPALAGAVAGTAGASAAVVVAVVLICLALPSALVLPSPPPRPPSSSTVRADVAAGVRAIVRTRPLARATATTVVSCAGQGILVACVPLLGARAFGSADHGAFLLSVLAASALAANFALSRWPALMRPDTVLWVSTLVLAAALLLAATVHPAALIAAAVVAGLGEGPQLTSLFAVRHREAPAHLLSQIFTTGASLKITGFAGGAALAGPLATRSLPLALLTAAATQLAAALTYAALSFRARTAPAQSAHP